MWGGNGTETHLVVFSIGHVFGLHLSILRRFTGELHEQQKLLKDGGIHHLEILRAHTNCLEQWHTISFKHPKRWGVYKECVINPKINDFQGCFGVDTSPLVIRNWFVWLVGGNTKNGTEWMISACVVLASIMQIFWPTGANNTTESYKCENKHKYCNQKQTLDGPLKNITFH